jgi:hypothetical protein
MRKIREKHGMTHHPLYKRWSDMRYRCNNPNHPVYRNYGGRGITVCERWDKSFVAYIEDVGEPPFKGAQIDRTDNNGPYSPENIRWVNQKEQCRNTRKNLLYTVDGVTKTQAEWVEIYDINQSTFRARMRNGWDVKDALTKPPIMTGWAVRNMR